MVEHLTFNQMVVGSNPAVLKITTKPLLWQVKKTKSIPTKWLLLTIYNNLFCKLYNFNYTYNLVHNIYLRQFLNFYLTPRTLGLGYYRTYRRLTNDPDTQLSKSLKKLKLRSAPKSVVHPKSTTLLGTFVSSWGLLRVKNNSVFSVHRDFQLLFFCSRPERRLNLFSDTRQMFNRWVDAHNFMFNLFYVQSIGQLLSNKFFIEESMMFNWHLSLKYYKLYKYIQPFFIFKDLPHGGYLHSNMVLFLKQKLDYMLIVDMNNHKTLITNLKRYHFYLIGAVPINYSPWLVSYPVPLAGDSLLNQLFFLKWLFSIKLSANAAKFMFYRKLYN